MRRLLGLHDLEKGEAARLLGVSAQAVSEWTSKTRKEGTRSPHVSTLERVSDFFELPGSLAWTPFNELLPLLADAERYDRVEKKIRARRSKLSVVGKATGRTKAVKPVEESNAGQR